MLLRLCNGADATHFALADRAVPCQTHNQEDSSTSHITIAFSGRRHRTEFDAIDHVLIGYCAIRLFVFCLL